MDQEPQIVTFSPANMGNKILVVDDELDKDREIYLQIFQKPIAEQLYSLEFVTTGEQALIQIQTDKKQEICLIILDLRLDGADVDGITLANTLAQLHIDKKVIIWTAFPEWESELSEEARKNVIKVLKRVDYSHHYLKDLTEAFLRGQLIDFPGKQALDKDSKLIGYHTIRKLAITLPAEQRYQLIEELMPYFPFATLQKLKENFPKLIETFMEKAIDKDDLRDWIAQKQEKGLLPPKVPPAYETDTFKIEIREFERINHYYERFYLRWTYNGKQDSIYLKNEWVMTLPQKFRVPPKYPDAAHVIYYPVSRKPKNP